MSTFDHMDPAPPNGLELAGPRVAYQWVDGPAAERHVGRAPEGKTLLVWHWCDYSVWHARAATDPAMHAELIPEPHWSATGAGAHDLIAAEPLHLEPSVYWPSCCGLHGWIRGGRWVGA